MAAALDASLTVVGNEPDRRDTLFVRARRMRMRLGELGVSSVSGRSQIVPVLLGDNDRAMTVAEALQAQGFDVRAIRPPTVPPGTARLRVAVNVGLSDGTVDEFAAACMVCSSYDRPGA